MPENSRYHSLDSLRAAMMLLGVVLHAAIAYMVLPFPWAYREPEGHVLFDVLVVWIHLFRMPVFFVMAGFFAALVYERRGPREFARHRVRRVGLPLLLGWLVIFPTVALAFVVGVPRWAPEAANGAAAAFAANAPDSGILIHLWFLYDLLYFYAAALLVLALGGRLGWRFDAGALLLRLLHSRLGLPALALVTAATLLPMQFGMLDTSASLVPAPRLLAAYGVFFLFGWLLWGQRRELLPRFEQGAWRRVGVSLLVFPLALAAAAVLGIAVSEPASPEPARVVLLKAAVALPTAFCTWLLVFGLIGLFHRYCSAPNGVWRYLADSAYAVYLVHLPFTLWLPLALAGLQLPLPLKFALVCLGTTLGSLLLYDLCIRSTWIGQLLNGRRYPRALPAPLARRRKKAECGPEAAS